MSFSLNGLSDYEIALRAAKSLMARQGYDMCEHDFQDMVHEGYLEIAELRKKGVEKPNEYYFAAARYAANHWRIFWKYGAYRQKIRNSRTCEYLQFVVLSYDQEIGFLNRPSNWIGYDEESEFWSNITNEKIRELLYKAKKRHNGVHNKALEEDLKILREIGEGKTNQQVAELMGKTEEFVKSKRQLLQKILKRYANERGIRVN